MTSHEMRNPLSAIILCADSIATCLSEFQATEGDQIQMTRDTLDNQAEAAQTIMLCAAHQVSESESGTPLHAHDTSSGTDLA